MAKRTYVTTRHTTVVSNPGRGPTADHLAIEPQRRPVFEIIDHQEGPKVMWVLVDGIMPYELAKTLEGVFLHITSKPAR